MAYTTSYIYKYTVVTVIQEIYKLPVNLIIYDFIVIIIILMYTKLYLLLKYNDENR